MVVIPLKNGGLKCQVSDFAVLVDPSSSARGDIVLRTFSPLPLLAGTDELINTAGEYEINGVRVRGIQINGESSEEKMRVVYAVELDEIRLCFLGGVSSPLSSEELDKLGEADILFLSSGKFGLDEKSAASLIKEIEPKAVIFAAYENLKALSAALGQNPEEVDKFTVKRKDLTEDSRKIMVFKTE
ncbi:MAG: MBL fold metallo-hydrolase [Patescibacteria group bacterium]|nr:MBL fold metallo-hydrolase [Patescibacteria group bacterium]